MILKESTYSVLPRCTGCVIPGAAGQGRVYPTGGNPVSARLVTTEERALGGNGVIQIFKRRAASRQAVSRKVEGIELRNRANGRGDVVNETEANIDGGAKTSDLWCPPFLRPLTAYFKI